MRNSNKIIVLCVMLSSLLFTTPALAKGNNNLLINKDTTKSINNTVINSELEFMIQDNVFALTNSNVTIKKVIQLYDVNGEPNYVLAVFNEGGYTIVTSQNAIISECNLHTGNSYPYKDYIDSGLIYAGPGNYVVEKNNQHIDSKSGKSVDLNVTDELIEKNDNMLSKEQNKEQSLQASLTTSSSISATATSATTWTGISSSRFVRYATWTNTDNTCGTYATAVMLAYLDDYIDDTFVPSSVRTRSSTSAGTLITKLKSFIGDDGSGTYPSDLNYGIGDFMDYYSLSHIQSSSELILVDTWAKDSIDKGWPAVLGIVSILGSPYGNHWVTAYSYSGEYYQAHDNWGDYAAIINNDWTTGLVWMVN